MTLYQELKTFNCETDSHVSDLYIKVYRLSTLIINKHKPLNVTCFNSAIDNSLWYDVPFMYDPFWNKKEI